MLEQCEPFNQSWPEPSMRHFDIATSLILEVLIARGLFTRSHPTLLRAQEHDRPWFLVSRWRCQSASCFCSRPLPIDVNKRTRTHHARPCHTSGRVRTLHARSCRTFRTLLPFFTRTLLARSRRTSGLARASTSGRARGLITRTHPTLHRALEHDRPRIRFSCVSRWQCPIAFCFVSHLAHITGIPLHDISHT